MRLLIIPILRYFFSIMLENYTYSTYRPLMPPPHPPIFQTHLYRNLFKPLPQQIPPAQDLMVPRIGNLVQRRHHLAPGRHAEIDLCLQLLLGSHDAFHRTGQRLAVPASARHAGQGGGGFAGPGALGFQLLPQFHL